MDDLQAESVETDLSRLRLHLRKGVLVGAESQGESFHLPAGEEGPYHSRPAAEPPSHLQVDVRIDLPFSEMGTLVRVATDQHRGTRRPHGAVTSPVNRRVRSRSCLTKASAASEVAP